MGSSPFDSVIVASLDELEDGFFEQMLHIFIPDLARSQEEIRVALDAHDLTRLAEQAHRLRSSAANIGATGLERVCTSLERDAREGDAESVEEQVWSLYAEVARIFTWSKHHAELSGVRFGVTSNDG